LGRGGSTLRTFKVKPDEVELVSTLEPRQAAKKLTQWARVYKQETLLAVGVDLEVNEGQQLDPVDKRLTGQHMELVWQWMRFSLNIIHTDAIVHLPGELTELYFRQKEKSTGSLEELEREAALLATMRFHLQHSKLCLCSVFGELGGEGSEHWTLLSIRRSAATHGAEVLEVEYFDSLSAEHSGCRAVAEQLLSALEISMPVPGRANCSMQPKGSGACGHYVLHWMEREVRRSRGEGCGSVPWAEYKDLRDAHLKMISALQKECAMWRKDIELKMLKSIELATAAEASKAKASKVGGAIKKSMSALSLAATAASSSSKVAPLC
jgi:hypothetical protein